MLVFQLHCFHDLNLEGIANPKEYWTTGKLNETGDCNDRSRIKFSNTKLQVHEFKGK